MNDEQTPNQERKASRLNPIWRLLNPLAAFAAYGSYISGCPSDLGYHLSCEGLYAAYGFVVLAILGLLSSKFAPNNWFAGMLDAAQIAAPIVFTVVMLARYFFFINFSVL